ncbi:hypothetical protein LCGC14_0890600 [marine sediment metagenome]|uniref:Uncharacterized protein n=1 Tax=marine sediment metagenome TaxID=412755 RepID=A0A0F9S6C3_9ZZZZ
MRVVCKLRKHKWVHIVNFIDSNGGVHLSSFDGCKYCDKTRIREEGGNATQES